MTIRLPRGDTPVIGANGAFNREWFKSLLANANTVNGLLSGTEIYTDTGVANAMEIASGLRAYTRGTTRYLTPAHTNNSVNVSLNDSGLGPISVKFPDGTKPAVGQIMAGVTLQVIYDGVFWEIQNLQTANQAILGDLTVTGTIDVTGAAALHGGVTVTGATAAGTLSATTTVAAGTTVTAGTTVATGVIAVGSLPSPVGIAGARYMVNNATATTFNSIVAATGANIVPVFSDGTNWRIG